MKYYYDHRKTNFLINLQYSGLHLLTPFELREIRDILKDPGFEIPYNTFYQFNNEFSYTFTFSKKDLLDNTDHLNFQIEIEAENPSKEKKKQIFESSNSIMTHQ